MALWMHLACVPAEAVGMSGGLVGCGFGGRAQLFFATVWLTCGCTVPSFLRTLLKCVEDLFAFV